MIDLQQYGLDKDDLDFLRMIREDFENQNEVDLKYKEYSFCIEPSGTELSVVDRNGRLGTYQGFDDLFLRFILDGRPLIERVKDLEFGE